MEIKDSGSVVLTAYHSYTPSRIPIIEQSFVPEISSSHSPISRKSLPQCRRINRMLSNESLHPPMFSRSNSQASVDSTSMEDFWCEVESIKENSEQGQEEQTLLEVKPADEGELEAEWLQDVGLSTLISGAEEEDGQALLSTLTRTQAAAVQRRYNTYTQTMRKKNKHSVRDVRDIFGVNDSSPTFETAPASPVPSNGIQLPGQKPVWKSVSSNSCLDCGLDKDSPSVTEELSYEVSFSESISVVPKNRERQNNLRFKKDDSALPYLRQEIEIKFHEDTFDWDQVRNNDAAGLLKMFIRELPSPLFTVEYLPAFITLVEKVSKVKLQLQALHLLIMLLPDANRDTAKAFLQFLKKIVANEGKNKMNLWNVSMIVAPNVFIYKGKHANQEEMQAAATTAHIVRLLIKYQDILWTVPSFLISQVRKMNEATMNNTKRQMMFDKGVRRLLRRKTMERERPERSETHIPEGVIRVYAPLHSKVSMAIQLNSQTKARDILARFHCANRTALFGPRCIHVRCLPCKSSSRMGDKTKIKLKLAKISHLSDLEKAKKMATMLSISRRPGHR
ncbi:rho GTPase-activating protein 28 isoform X7 [Lepidochelys kempii]|uniref:rho GTPase-activating protein 28 isoform X7 n=1 Tax=Lepidochelys kempii TaxID=8472 RepID=UPI003C7035FF